MEKGVGLVHPPDSVEEGVQRMLETIVSSTHSTNCHVSAEEKYVVVRDTSWRRGKGHYLLTA